jgi:hypothetical protein
VLEIKNDSQTDLIARVHRKKRKSPGYMIIQISQINIYFYEEQIYHVVDKNGNILLNKLLNVLFTIGSNTKTSSHSEKPVARSLYNAQSVCAMRRLIGRDRKRRRNMSHFSALTSPRKFLSLLKDWH